MKNKKAALIIDGAVVGGVEKVEVGGVDLLQDNIREPELETHGKASEMDIEAYKRAQAEKYERLERGGSARKPHHNKAQHKRKKPGKKTHRKQKK